MVEAIGRVTAIETFTVLSGSLSLDTFRSQQSEPGLKQVQESERPKNRHPQPIVWPPAVFTIQVQSEHDLHLMGSLIN